VIHTVLLIDDDEQLAQPLRSYFSRYELNLINEVHPLLGLQRLQQGNVDLVILDVMLPEMDGFEACKKIRQDSRLKELPVLILTARGDVMDRVIGLELGADDYLSKPFEPRELVARIHNILRRTHSSTVSLGEGSTLNFLHLSLDLEKHCAKLDNQLLELTNGEYQMLVLLAQYPGKIFTRDDFLNILHGIDTPLNTRAIDIQISRLRKKIQPLRCIQTQRGSGYLFIASEA
jgi:OmpR family response regulator RpaB